jgi:hypothetical protein
LEVLDSQRFLLQDEGVFRIMTSRLFSIAAALTLTLLVGRIVDMTTGQPLGGVLVQTGTGTHRLSTRTGPDGRFVLRGLAPGNRRLHVSSRDVPPQTLSIRVRGKRETLLLHACSTTLDYHCGGTSGGGGA